MTVSRVLRHSPGVSKPTRLRVTEAAARIGYRPNPHAARLMAIVRSAKQRHIQAVIAVIRDRRPESRAAEPAHQYHSIEDIRARAAQHGYLAEEFFIGHHGLTPGRLRKILRARGIEAVMVSPQSFPSLCADFDYEGFASVTFGYGLRSPSLHLASTNMTQGILDATAQLMNLGYRRIGVAITEWVDERADHTYSGALLHFQQKIPRTNHVPLLLFPGNELEGGADRFCRWFRRCQPDAIISFDRHVPDWLTRRLGLNLSRDIGFVVHDWTRQMAGFAGIDHRRPQVGAAAIDMVATQLMHGESGVPEVPRQILIPPRFVLGESVRRQVKGRSGV